MFLPNRAIFSFLILLILSLAPARAESRLGICAGAGTRSISGDLQLKSGFGLQLGLIVPFSNFFDLYGSIILPRKYDVDDPQGQVFSAGNYERVYSSLQFTALSAGMLFIGKFSPGQEYLPLLNLAFGKSWLYGSGSDGFTGIDFEYGAGVRYLKNRHWSFQIMISRIMIDFTKIKINGDSNDISVEQGAACTCLTFSALYTFSLGID